MTAWLKPLVGGLVGGLAVSAQAQVVDLDYFRIAPPAPLYVFQNHARLVYAGDDGQTMYLRIEPLTPWMVSSLDVLTDADMVNNILASLCVMFVYPGQNLDSRRMVLATPGRYQGDRWVRADFQTCLPILQGAGALPGAAAPVAPTSPGLLTEDMQILLNDLNFDSLQRNFETIFDDPPEY
jgi:hypothetical protein